MKLVLSRKGFDSTAGRVPSPIFPDGTMLSLPIPDKSSRIRYQDLSSPAGCVGDIVEQLAGIPRTHRAHLDPDLRAASLPRAKGWKPLFGQVGAAERHLQKQGVGVGDLFLFFGLFRRVEISASGWQYARRSRPIHTVFGWFQIGARVAVSDWPTASKAWAAYHPHFRRRADPANVLYVAGDRMALTSENRLRLPGAGVFGHYSPKLRLTAPHATRPGTWLLPEWFYPGKGQSPLTYHGKLSRWQKSHAGVELSVVGRGQEFVLDCDEYSEAIEWVAHLLRRDRK